MIPAYILVEHLPDPAILLHVVGVQGLHIPQLFSSVKRMLKNQEVHHVHITKIWPFTKINIKITRQEFVGVDLNH